MIGEALLVIFLVGLVCLAIDIAISSSSLDDKNHPSEDEIEQ